MTAMVVALRSPMRRYGVALALAAIAIAVAELLESLSGPEFYPPLIGAVVVAVWLGGPGPGLAAIAAAWGYEAVANRSVTDGYWLTALAVALAIVWITSALRAAQARAEARTLQATQVGRYMDRLHELASKLSAAATPAEVSRALVDDGARVLGARSGAVGLVVGDQVEILDPGTGAGQTVEPGLRLPLESRTVLCAAIRAGAVRWAGTRAEVAARYPDGLAVAPAARGVLAAPLRMLGEVVGGIGFHYAADGEIDEECIALAGLAADLGGQALERARLYDEERSLSEGLDRALRVAPRADGGSPKEVAAGICREARRTFGSDVALMLSIPDDEQFAVDWREPASVLVPPGLQLPFEELPDLRGATESGAVMWVPDLLESLRGEALEIARALGTVSALRVPILLSGRVGRILVLQWDRRASDPSPAQLALARRFADQAGLALEQAERRSAEELAERRAADTRRLLEVTSALAAAATTDAVVETLLGHGALALGADEGMVALREEDALVVVGSVGVDSDTLERRFPLSEARPLADAIRRNEMVVIENADDLKAVYPMLDYVRARGAHTASISIPIVGRGAAIGGVGFGFERPRRIDGAQRQLVAAIVRQASEALERTRLHEAERASRARTERSAARLAQLHALGMALGRARTEADVAAVVTGQIASILGTRSASIHVVDEERAELRPVGGAGPPGEGAARESAAISLAADVPLAMAARAGDAIWSNGDAAEGMRGVVPMVVEGRRVGVLDVSFGDEAPADDDARRFVETVARYAGQPLDRVRLLHVERSARAAAEQASQRTARLQAATEALVAATTTAEIADTALGQALAAAGSSTGLLFLRALGAEHVDVAAAAGVPRTRLDELARLPLSESSPVAQTIETGELEAWSAEELAARYPEFARRQGGKGSGGAVCVPLTIGATRLGVAYLALDPGTLGTDDREVLRTIGAQSGEALERSRLHEAEQAAAMRLQRLHTITASLSGAATVEEVGRATLEEAAAAVAAAEGALLLTNGAGMATVVASVGFAAGTAEQVRVDALDEVVDASAPVWALGTGASYPFRAAEISGWAGLPLRGSGRIFGALVLGFAHPRELASEDRAWLLAVAAQCGQALERSRLYEAERETRERVERLQSLTSRLSMSLTPSEVASAVLAEGRAALGAESAALVGFGENGDAPELVEHEGASEDSVRAWQAARLDVSSPLADAVGLRQSVFLESRAVLRDRYPAFEGALGLPTEQAWAVAPLTIGDRVLAALWFGWREPREFRVDDRLFVDTLARQFAQALDRARRHDAERQIAETLQRSMLPDSFPEVPRVTLAARYLPGTAGLEVGGDWYDAVLLENGRLGLAVGDVVGKGIKAASTMGQLRNALRAFALQLLRPATAVARLNALMDTFGDVPFATLVYMTLDPVRRVCRYTVAGHLPPLLLRPDGTVERLEGGRSLPLGVDGDVEFFQSTAELDPGSTILLYTDGLVERTDSSLEDGLERLAISVGGTEAAALDPETLADRVLRELLGDRDPRDDVALLVVKLAPAVEPLSLRLPGEPAGLLALRRDVRSWLGGVGATADQADDVVLACWEACANAIEYGALEHGFGGSAPEGSVELSFETGIVSVRVDGAGTWRPPAERDGRGFGLRLVSTLMDSVRVEPTGGGTLIRMTRAIGTV